MTVRYVVVPETSLMAFELTHTGLLAWVKAGWVHLCQVAPCSSRAGISPRALFGFNL